MSLKIVDARRLLALIVVASFLGASCIPLSYAFTPNCPSAGSTVTTNLTLNSNCSYSGDGFSLANGVTLNCAGYSIIQTTTPLGVYYAVQISDAYGVTVKNCVFSGAWFNGVLAEYASGLMISGNTFTTGTSGAPAWSLYFGEYVTTSNVIGNTVTGCTGAGFWAYDSYNIAFLGNTATCTTTAFGFQLSSSTGSLTGNVATGNKYGFEFYGATGFTLIKNKADSNTDGYYDNSYASAYGPGTLGLGNTYINNECHSNTSYGSYDDYASFGPAFLCTPQG